MKQRLDDDLNSSLKKLEFKIRMKPEYHEQLRKRILSNNSLVSQQKSSRKKVFLLASAIILFLLGSSPFYSTTMASLVAKIIPLEIKVNDSSLHDSISNIIKEQGYEWQSIGAAYNPYTIRISLMNNGEKLSSMKEVLVPKMEEMLYEHGIDRYKLEITLFEEKLYEENVKLNSLMEKAHEIITDTFRRYGYTELSQTVTFGMQDEYSSKTLTLNMPDHIENTEEILSDIKKEIQKENLDIKNVELQFYNEKHRKQDIRWGPILSDIHKSLAGKSLYAINGASYKVKDGVSNVWLKTALPNEPSKQILLEIETAIQEYLASPEVKEKIQNDQYNIYLQNEEKIELLRVSNVPIE